MKKTSEYQNPELQNMTLASVIQSLRDQKDYGITIVGDTSRSNDQFMAYADLYKNASRMLGCLQNLGFEEEEEVVFQIADIRSFLTLFWACILGRYVPVPLSMGDRPEYNRKLIQVLNTLPTSKVVIDKSRTTALRDEHVIKEAILEGRLFITEELLASETFSAKIINSTPSQLAFVQYSSGSTNAPKGVSLSHANLLHNAQDIIDRSQIDHNDITLSWMPLTHDMGMIGFHLTSVLAGINQVIFPPALFVRRPLLWLELTSAYKASVLFSPNFGYRHLLDAMVDSTTKSNLDTIRIIYNGAEPISHELVHEFHQKLASLGLSDRAILPCYGLAEASVAVSLPKPGAHVKVHHLHRKKLAVGKLLYCKPDDSECVSFVDTGHAVDHCNIRICDDEDQPLSEKQIGHIHIQGANVTDGYYKAPDLNKEMFTPDNWLRTGDLGFMKDKRLIITGRIKNLIVINGQNYYPHDFENLVNELPTVNNGCAAVGIRKSGSWQEQIVLFVVFKGKTVRFASLVTSIEQLFYAQTSLELGAVIPVKRLPKTTSGKVQYFSLAQDFKEGLHDEVIVQIKDYQKVELSYKKAIPEVLVTIFEEVFGFVPDQNAVLMEQSGLNSLKVLQYLSRINRQYGTDFGFKDIFVHETINALATCLATLTSTVVQDINISATKPQADYALNQAQQRLNYLDQLSNPIGNNIGVAWKVSGQADEERIRRALETIVKRHQSLRTQIVLKNDDNRLNYRSAESINFSIERQLFNTTELTQTQKDFLSDFASRRFDLTTELPVRLLICHSDGFFVLALAFSHIVVDGWSVHLIVKELNACLGDKPLTELSDLNFHDIANWKERQLADNLESYRRFWHDQLQEWQPPAHLPFERTAQEKISFRHAHQSYSFPSHIFGGIRELSKEAKSSPFNVLVSTIAVLLHKYTRQSDICVGTDSYGRTLPEENNIVGYFLKTLITRIRLASEMSFIDLVGQVTRNFADLLHHQDYPYELLQKELTPPDNSSNLPVGVFDILVVYRNFGDGAVLEAWQDDQQLTLLEIPQQNGFAKLQFEFVEEASELKLNLSYDKELFDSKDIGRLIMHFDRLLSEIIHQSEKPLSSYQMIEALEIPLILERGKGTTTTHPGDLVTTLENSVLQHGHMVAVITTEKTLTYAQLWEDSGQLAKRLVSQTEGLSRRIGVALERNEQRIVALISILRAGCSFVPINTKDRSARIDHILTDSGTDLIITQNSILEYYHQKAHCLVIDEPTSNDLLADLPKTYDQHAEAYVLYTSGTTGTPKGVAVSRFALSDYIDTFSCYFELSTSDVVLHQGSLSFDLALEEIFPVLAVGGKLAIGEEGGYDIADLVRSITVFDVTVLSTTPSVISELNANYSEQVGQLRVLISGGERLLPQHIDSLIGYTKIFNTYGPTETTVCATYHEVSSLENVSLIGKPIANRELLVLDGAGGLLPDGVPGELYIGGHGLCIGYLNEQDLNDRVFVPHPYEPTQKIFKTGDLVCRLEDGNLEYLGRMDKQVKINGYRIEPGEIASQLLQIESIDDAYVLARFDDEGHTELVAYVVSPEVVHLGNTVKELEKSLPTYMVPRQYYQVPQFPRNASGKVAERDLLSKYDSLAPLKVDFQAPKNEREQRLATIWSMLLGAAQISSSDHFFQLGGDSLAAAKLLARIRVAFNVKLSLGELFKYPHLYEMAELLSLTNANLVLPKGHTKKRKSYELTNAQRRLWFLQELEQEPRSHNIAIAVEFKGALNTDRFVKALGLLIERHDSLRSVYRQHNGNVEMLILTPKQVPASIDYEDASNNSDPSAYVTEKLAEMAREPFHLEIAPLFRITQIKVSESEHIVGLCIHHIIADGWSLNIIKEELFQLYEQLEQEQEACLPILPINFTDYSIWLSEQQQRTDNASSTDYWVNKLSGKLPRLELPADRPRKSERNFFGSTHTTYLPELLIREINAYQSASGINLFPQLLSIVFTLLHKYTKQDDIILGVPLADRPHPDFENTVGMMLEVITLRHQFGSDVDYDKVTNSVQKELIDSIDHRNFPFERLVDTLDTDRDLSRSPIFDVMVNLNVNDEGVVHDNFELHSYPVQKSTAKYDLTFNFWEQDSSLRMDIEYSEELFNNSRIARMAEHFSALALQLVQNNTVKIAELPYFYQEEADLLLKNQSGEQVEVVSENILHAFFESSEKLSSDVAIYVGKRSISFADLQKKVLDLSQCLIDKYDLKKGDVVGLLMARSENMVVSMLAVWNAGAAFLPIDPGFPEARTSYILKHSGARYLIYQEYNQTLSTGSIWISYEQIILESESFCGKSNAEHIEADDLAYVIYTSGSTGKPKGVKICHDNLSNFSIGMRRSLELSNREHLLAITSISFDISILELIWSLVEGHTITIKEDLEIHSFDRFLDNGENKPMEFSLFYFSSSAESKTERYQLLLDSVRYADKAGFKAVWVPERHFHQFGGIFPNPGLLGTALAAISEHIEIRSGSLVLPINDTVRAAQLWASLDRKSSGRVGISVASGWHADDFVFFPERFEGRREGIVDQITQLKALWTGKKTMWDGIDREAALSALPSRNHLPIWVTAAGNPDTFSKAGKTGSNILTHMLGQDLPTLTRNIAVYKRTLRANDYDPDNFTVSIMLHTYIGESIDQVEQDVKEPFKNYLRSSLGLIANLAKSMGISLDQITETEMDDLLEVAFDRYWQTSALMGTVEKATAFVKKLGAIGVTEIGALVDFGIPQDKVMAALPLLNQIKMQFDLSRDAKKVEKDINTLQTTPSLLKILTQDVDSRTFLARLEHIIVGGERVPQELIDAVQKLSDATVHQVYGPTETTIWSTYQRVGKGKQVTAGKPIVNTQIYILDNSLKLQPVGIPGNVYIGGKGVSQGYINNSDLTSQVFIQNPSTKKSDIIYKTGDLGYWSEDSELMITGRSDNQVKINGYRIELHEIEYLVRRQPHVVEAVVVVQSEDEHDIIIAFIQSEIGDISEQVREALKLELPAYMMPKVIYELEDIPLTPNGKIDRKALVNFKLEITKPVPIVQTNGTVQQVLLELWQESLLTSDVGTDDSFFKLGGNSLMATLLISKIRDRLQVNIRLRDVFAYPTIADLTSFLESEYIQRKAIGIAPVDGNKPWYPVGYNQLHLWVLAQLQHSRHAFNEAKAFTINGDFDRSAFEKAFAILIGRHESLRTYFRKIEGSPRQIIRRPEEAKFKIDFTDLTEEVDKQNFIDETITRYINTDLDITEGPLLKAELIRLSTDQYLFVYTKNHIISDEWSKRVMMRELISYYNVLVLGELPKPQPLRIQFKDFVVWQRNRIHSEELDDSRTYWSNQLKDSLPGISLPYDYPRPSEKDYRGAIYESDFGTTLYAQLQQLGEEQSATLFMTLLSSLYVLMHRYSGQDDIIIGSPVSGRNLPELEDQIGLYMDALPLRQKVDSDYSFLDFLMQVKETVLNAFEHQDYPFDAILDDLKLKRDVSHAPLFDVLLLIQDDQMWQSEILQAESITIDNYPISKVNSKFDLTFLFNVSDRSIKLSIEYSTSLFTHDTITNMAKDLGKIIELTTIDPQLLISDENLIEKGEFEKSHSMNFAQEIT